MGFQRVLNFNWLVWIVVGCFSYAAADLAEPALQCYQCRDIGCDITADCGPKYKNCYKAKGKDEEGEEFYESGCAEFTECEKNVKGTKDLKEERKKPGKEEKEKDDSASTEFREEEAKDKGMKIEECVVCEVKLCNGQLALHFRSACDVIIALVLAVGSITML